MLNHASTEADVAIVKLQAATDALQGVGGLELGGLAEEARAHLRRHREDKERVDKLMADVSAASHDRALLQGHITVTDVESQSKLNLEHGADHPFSYKSAGLSASVVFAIWACLAFVQSVYGNFPRSYWPIPAALGILGVCCNILYATRTGRFLDLPMAFSCSIILMPGMILWADGYPIAGVWAGYAVTWSTAADAMRPFTHYGMNGYVYEFDMVIAVCTFCGCLPAFAHYTKCAFAELHVVYAVLYLLYNVLVFSVPGIYWKWKANKLYTTKTLIYAQTKDQLCTERWRPYHMLWHVIAVSCCAMGFGLAHLLFTVGGE